MVLAHLPLAAAAPICVVSALAGFLIRSWLVYPARHLATARITGAMAGVAIMLVALVIS